MHGIAQTALILTLIALNSPAVQAHGGPQESLQILASPQPSVVRTNYGLLRFESDSDWRWTCEEVAGTVEITDYTIDEDGNQILSNYDGLYRSMDGCQWDLVENEIKGGFVTDLEVDDGRIWATTGLSGSNNGLWFSEDGGLSFSLDSNFGTDSEIRSVKHQGDWLWITGWTDDTPWAAHRETSDDPWTRLYFEHEDNSIGSMSVHQVEESGNAWVVLSRESTDEVWEITPSGVFHLRLSANTKIEAMLIHDDLGIVGTRDEIAWQSVDGGETWTEYTEVPHMGCLSISSDLIHICSHNWRDGAAAMAAPHSLKPLDEWEWSPTLWYGDVRAMESCPEDSTVANRCEPLWSLVVPAGGYNIDRDEDTGSHTNPNKGCGGCAQTQPFSNWVWLLGFLVLLVKRPHGGRGTVIQ